MKDRERIRRQRQSERDRGAAAPAPNPRNPSDFHIRRLIIKCEADVYNERGELQQRGLSEDAVIVEAEFTEELIAALSARVPEMGRGFKKKFPKPEPTPQLVENDEPNSQAS